MCPSDRQCMCMNDTAKYLCTFGGKAVVDNPYWSINGGVRSQSKPSVVTWPAQPLVILAPHSSPLYFWTQPLTQSLSAIFHNHLARKAMAYIQANCACTLSKPHPLIYIYESNLVAILVKQNIKLVWPNGLPSPEHACTVCSVLAMTCCIALLNGVYLPAVHWLTSSVF